MRKIFILTMILIVLISTVSCSSKATDMNSSDNFVKIEYGLVYDIRTEIVYYMNRTYLNYGIVTPFYGEDKELVTKDEYYDKYK